MPGVQHIFGRDMCDLLTLVCLADAKQLYVQKYLCITAYDSVLKWNINTFTVYNHFT